MTSKHRIAWETSTACVDRHHIARSYGQRTIDGMSIPTLSPHMHIHASRNAAYRDGDLCTLACLLMVGVAVGVASSLSLSVVAAVAAAAAVAVLSARVFTLRSDDAR